MDYLNMNQYNRDFNGNDIFEYDTSCGRMLDRCVCVCYPYLILQHISLMDFNYV